MNSKVVNLVGVAGVGKTHLLEELRRAHPGSVQILSPTGSGEVMDASVADFDAHGCVAVDEVLKWDRDAIKAAVPRLEAAAAKAGKLFVLVTQSDRCLADAGIALENAPDVIRISRQGSVAIVTDDAGAVSFQAV